MAWQVRRMRRTTIETNEEIEENENTIKTNINEDIHEDLLDE